MAEHSDHVGVEAGPLPGGAPRDEQGFGVPFADDLVQLLTPEGQRVEHPDFAFTGDDETVAGYLRDMTLARRLDSEATALQRIGELGLWPPALGQEAAQVGSGRSVGPLDMVFPTYREHAVGLIMGVDPVEMMSTFRGTGMGGWDSAQHRFHLYTFVIGSQTLHATGYAMGLQRDGLVGNPPAEDEAAKDEAADNAAVLAYFGDGASSQGDVNEAFVFAASYNAPVVFFCQNNQWAISEPIARQSKIPLYQRAHGFGFPGVRVDGNDVLACHAVTDWALRRARSGQGPALIEAFTYRMGAHTTSDDPTKYRLADELEHWRLKDPIARVRAYLERQTEVPASFFSDLDREADDFAADLRRRLVQLPEPQLVDWFERVYADMPHTLRDQQAELRAYQASFLAEGETAGAVTHESEARR